MPHHPPSRCDACGGAVATNPAAPYAYDHTVDCRVRQRIDRCRGLREVHEAIERSSLGTPGAKAVIKVGQLYAHGLSPDEVREQLQPAERWAADQEMERIEREVGRWRAP